MVTFTVRGHPFGYLWERTETVGLKQTLSEQLALVAERPEASRSSSRPASSARWSSTWSGSTAASWPS